MYKGDLSNKMMPRLILVFEGAVGVVPEDKKREYAKACQKKKWWDAIRCYDLNDMMLAKILDLHWRRDINVSVVTWLSQDAALAIEERMDEEGIPIRGCFFSKPAKLARELAYMPEVMAIYDPDPDHVFTYGSKGVVITDVNQLGRY